MRSITNLAVAVAGVLIMTVTTPADAAYGRWCWNHPRACHRSGPGVHVIMGPRVGVYFAGRGYWDGHRYWGHRYWARGGWRYR
jgi:hypothetical protein